MGVIALLAHAGATGGWFPTELPPVHPILVNFTAALLPASLLSDVLGRILRRPSLTAAGWWTLLYAAVITPLTALAGWWWFRQMADMDHPQMAVHKWLGTGLAAAFLALLWWRWRIRRRQADGAPGWPYLICAALLFLALVLQGHLGGTMSFGDSGGGGGDDRPAPEHQGHEPAAAATQASGHGIQWHDHLDVKGK